MRNGEKKFVWPNLGGKLSVPPPEGESAPPGRARTDICIGFITFIVCGEGVVLNLGGFGGVYYILSRMTTKKGCQHLRQQ